MRTTSPSSLFFQYIWSRVPEFVFFILPVDGPDDDPARPRLPDQVQRDHGHEGLRHQPLPADLPRPLHGASRRACPSFYLQERVLPRANNKAEEIWNRINDAPSRSYSYLNRHWVLGRDKNRIYHYDFFDPGPVRVQPALDLRPRPRARGRWPGGPTPRRPSSPERPSGCTDGWARRFSGGPGGGLPDEGRRLEMPGDREEGLFPQGMEGTRPR